MMAIAKFIYLFADAILSICKAVCRALYAIARFVAKAGGS